MAEPLPWHRKTGETAKAYQAFLEYCFQGQTRSLSKVGQSLGKSTTLMAQWSTKWGWVDRCAAYDAHLDKLRLETEEEERIKMAKRHAAMARSLQGIAAARMNEWKKQIEDKQVPDLTPIEVMKLAVEGVKLERLVKGETTDSINNNLTSEKVKPIRFVSMNPPAEQPGDQEKDPPDE